MGNGVKCCTRTEEDDGEETRISSNQKVTGDLYQSFFCTKCVDANIPKEKLLVALLDVKIFLGEVNSLLYTSYFRHLISVFFSFFCFMFK